MSSVWPNRVSICLVLCLGGLPGRAQSTTSSIARLTTANGLPHNSITGVRQDRAGFVWIATLDGLARYDGRTVDIFRNRPGDTTSLIDNKIIQFEPTADGSFLITTGSGSFQHFDPVTEQFTTVLTDSFLARRKVPVTDGQLSADGLHFWGLQPGIRLIDYDLRRKTLRVYDLPKLIGRPNEIDDFTLTKTGYVYSTTTTGLFQFDTRTGRSRIIPFPFKPLTKLESANFVPINRHQVVEGPDGQIAFFGYQAIILYDPVRNRYRTAPIPDAVPNRLVSPTLKGVDQVNTVYYSVQKLADNRLHVGYQNRLYRLDDGDRLTLIKRPGAPTDRVTPWLLDRSNVLWFSGEATGISRIDFRALPFRFAPKRKSFAEDLVQQDLGLALPDSFEVWEIPRWPRYMVGPNRIGYLIDPSRVYRHRVGERKLTELTSFWNTNGEICCKLCMKVSRAGRVWVYSNRLGLVEADLAGTTDVLYPHSQVPLVAPNPGHDVGDIQPMGQSVWVGARFGLGLFRYDLVRKRFDKPLVTNPASVNSLPSNSIFCLAEDPSDSSVLWIGTAGGGLCRLNTRTLTFQRLGEAEGFPNGTIQSIEADAQGQLWCGTNRGLIRLARNAGSAKTITWRHFTTADGLADNEFLRHSSARLPDGRLVFGVPAGRIIFDPKAIRTINYEPPVVLTSLQINNKPAAANRSADGQAGPVLPAPLNTLPQLVLNYTQNFLTIGFAGLDYGRTGKITYRYKLAGVDANWVMSGTQNTANYTQLAPGQYLFSVNSTTADGQWSRQIKQLPIVITPPFWATWWAYLSYALLFGSLVLGFIRFRLGQARQQQEIALKRREADQLRAVDEVKTRFFSNITHEFRTPLTLILSPVEQLLTAPDQPETTRQSLLTIHQNAGQLLRLINQLLDLSKLEGGNMNVSLVRGESVALIQRLIDPFYPMAANRGITLHVEAGHIPAGQWLFDADKWEKIITNLLSNALKFTPSGGQVTLTIEQPTDDRLVLHLTDTGIGIAPAHLPHIFDRFYQVDTSRTRDYEGTGIGLALVKELTDLLGGTITVSSRTEAPTGTRFTLTLPLLPVSVQPDAAEITRTKFQSLSAYPDVEPLAVATDSPLLSLPADAPLILVVDDNDKLRAFIAGELMNRYRVLTAADGEAAWEICQHELPDIVVSDVMMPRLDGYQLTHCIKSTLATSHIAVVLLTARAAQESRIAGLEQGADDYLTKPFHVDELFLRLSNMLTRQASLRAHLYRQLATPAPTIAGPVVDPFVKQLQEAIETRLDDTDLNVDQLAQLVSMSRRTLHRKLTAVASLSPNDFIRHYRLQRAIQLLKAGQSIAETAYSVGFESPGYFATVFKQTYQQTPTEFLSRQQV